MQRKGVEVVVDTSPKKDRSKQQSVEVFTYVYHVYGTCYLMQSTCLLMHTEYSRSRAEVLYGLQRVWVLNLYSTKSHILDLQRLMGKVRQSGALKSPAESKDRNLLTCLQKRGVWMQRSWKLHSFQAVLASSNIVHYMS